MKNNTIITALEFCKAVLIEELRAYVAGKPGQEVNCCVYLPIYTDDTYNLDGYWSQEIVKKLFIDPDTKLLMVGIEEDDELAYEPIGECFNVGEIASIIDHLD